MKLALALVIIPAIANAEDFDGTWKVPDAQRQNAAACKKGDAKECLRLAWTTEAGVSSAGMTPVARLEKARDFHKLACTAAKKTTCSNEARVQAKLDALNALKTDAERAQFWCGDALEGAARFETNSKTAPAIVRKGCIALLPARFKKAVDAVAGSPMKAEMLFAAAKEDICPTLTTKPAACEEKSPKDARASLAAVFAAALTGEAAKRADVLADWLTR